mgnify:CR=1 FL=1
MIECPGDFSSIPPAPPYPERSFIRMQPASSHSRPPATQHLGGLGFRIYRNEGVSAMVQPHTHLEMEFNFVQGASFTYLHGGVRQTVVADRLAVFWAGIPHQTLEGSTASRGIWGYLPLPWILQWNLPHGFSNRLLSGELFEFPISAAEVEGWITEMESPVPEMRELLELELRTAFTRLALTLPQAEEPAPVLQSNLTGGELHIARITSYLAHHYASPMTIDNIAEHAGLTRGYLMHLFRQHCGISVWDYLTRLRISHAQRLLSTTRDNVADVALACGFKSVTPFYVAFTRHAGCRPLDYRRQARP